MGQRELMQLQLELFYSGILVSHVDHERSDNGATNIKNRSVDNGRLGQTPHGIE